MKASAPLVIVCAVIFVVAASLVGCSVLSDVGRERSYGVFTSPGGASVEIVGIQRMPTSWGAEENAYVRSLAAADAPRIEFDINGRFGPGLRVDVSADGTWVRIWDQLDPPAVGEVGDVPPDAHYFLDYTQGQTSRQDVFRASLTACVNLRTGFVLRYSSATSAERRERFRLLSALPDTEDIRGERVQWTRATRK